MFSRPKRNSKYNSTHKNEADENNHIGPAYHYVIDYI